MGDPRKQRKKYAKPLKRWSKERIEEEKKLVKEYGLKNKKELFRVTSLLRRIKGQAKGLAARKGGQAEKEKALFFKRLSKLSLIGEGAKLEDVLDLSVSHILSRRLQTQVAKLGLAGTVRQARQFIIHGHIFVGDRKMSIPSYMVLRGEEGRIRFSSMSAFTSEDHPEMGRRKAAAPAREKPGEKAK